MDEHPPGFFEHREAFGPDGKYGKWIRSNRAVVQVGDGVFVHGGLNPALEFASVRELTSAWPTMSAPLTRCGARWSTPA